MQKVMEATKGRQEKLEEAFGIKPEDKALGKKDPVERKTGEKTLNPNTDSNPPESKTEKLKPASAANDSEQQLSQGRQQLASGLPRAGAG